MIDGYATPNARQIMRLGLGIRILKLLVLQNGIERTLDLRCWGASGMLMMVRPIRRLYPKCRDGIAAYWLQNLFWVHTLLSPSLPCTVSTKPKLRASSPIAPGTLGSERRRGGMHGQRVKTMKARRLHMAIVRRRASYRRGPAGEPFASLMGLLLGRGIEVGVRVVV